MRSFPAFAFLALFSAFLSSPLQAASPLEQIQATISKPDILCGNFQQEKNLKGIVSPLRSAGRFCVHGEKGILWRNLTPFRNTLRLTRNEIVMMQGDRVTNRLDAKQEPMVQMINGVLFSLVSGDLSQLESLFEIDAQIRSTAWNVTLKPRHAALSRVISLIGLRGDTYVRQVVIQEASGDRTGITFSDIRTGRTALLADEVKGYE